MSNATIRFTIIENNKKQVIETYDGEYRNLMFLLKDKLYLDDFGECSGMGRCATCIVRINGLTGSSATKERNEPVTLSQRGYTEDNIRLSCQLYITADLENTEIEVLG